MSITRKRFSVACPFKLELINEKNQIIDITGYFIDNRKKIYFTLPTSTYSILRITHADGTQYFRIIHNLTRVFCNKQRPYRVYIYNPAAKKMSYII